MTHGTPDWAEGAPRSTVYGGVDLGELAARLGSLIAFDRRGDVMWLDGFGSGLTGWRVVLGGAGSGAEVSATTCRTDGFSAKLTSGADGAKAIYLYRYLPYPVLSVFGVELPFTITDGQYSFRVQVRLYDGAYMREVYFQYMVITQRVQIMGPLGIRHIVEEGVDLLKADYLFHVFKLVFDLPNLKYKRLILDSTEYDISDIGIWGQADLVTEPSMRIMIEATQGEAVAISNYVDNIILTQNEP